MMLLVAKAPIRPDDFVGSFTAFDGLPERFRIGPQQASETLADDGDTWRTEGVLFKEETAGEQRNAERAKVIAADNVFCRVFLK